MAAHLLANGIAASSLRALAVAAATSDRMLLYYFADKEELLTALLEHIAARLVALLEPGPSRMPYAALLDALWEAARTPALNPYMLLFIELAAAAGRGEEPHRTAAMQIAEGFAIWVSDHLDVAEPLRTRQAMLLLATLDGMFVLHSAGLKIEPDQARID